MSLHVAHYLILQWFFAKVPPSEILGHPVTEMHLHPTSVPCSALDLMAAGPPALDLPGLASRRLGSHTATMWTLLVMTTAENHPCLPQPALPWV